MAVIPLKKHHLLTLGYGFLALVPIIIFIICVQQNAVNIPIMDEWELVKFRLEAINDSVSFSDVFALHNEHRIASLRMISLALGQLSAGWNSTLLIAINVIIVILTSWVLFWLAWRQFSTFNEARFSSPELHLFGITTVVTSFLFFSPSQYENWLSGFQIPWFLINLILIAVALLLYEFFKAQQPLYFVSAIGLCVVASFSSAHGLFIWLACLPMFSTRGLKRSTRLSWAGVWMGATAITGITYMAGYSKPANHPSTSLVLERPGAAIDFFLNLLGNAFGRGGTANFILGLVILLAFGCLVLFCYKQQPKTWNDALVWFSIGLFPIIFAATTTAGRLGLGAGAALPSRYATVTLLLPICLVQLLRIVIQQKGFLEKLTLPLTVSLILFGFILASLVDGYQSGLAAARNTLHDRNVGRTCLELYEYLDPAFADQCIAQRLYPAPAVPLELAKELREAGAIATSPIVLSHSEQQIDGNFDEAVAQNNHLGDVITVSGWAFSDGNPGVVLLSADEGKSFFSIMVVNKHRRDVARAYSGRYLQSGWEGVVSADMVTSETQSLTAYFYDFQQRELLRIGQKAIPSQTHES